MANASFTKEVTKHIAIEIDGKLLGKWCKDPRHHFQHHFFWERSRSWIKCLPDINFDETSPSLKLEGNPFTWEKLLFDWLPVQPKLVCEVKDDDRALASLSQTKQNKKKKQKWREQEVKTEWQKAKEDDENQHS